MNEEFKEKEFEFVPHSNFHKIIITQVIVLGIILAGVFLIKYTNMSNYKKITAFYEKYFCDDTSVTQVLQEDDVKDDTDEV